MLHLSLIQYIAFKATQLLPHSLFNTSGSPIELAVILSLCFSNSSGFWEYFGRLSLNWTRRLLKILTISPFDCDQEVPESLRDRSRPIRRPKLWRKTEVGTNVWICSLLCHPRQITGKDIFTMNAEKRTWLGLTKHLAETLVHFSPGLLGGQCATAEWNQNECKCNNVSCLFENLLWVWRGNIIK